MESAFKEKVALIIVNWDYEGYENLQFPESDGSMMQDMMNKSGFNSVKVVQNSENITTEVAKFIEENNDKAIDMFHFHYSGHGVFNANIELNMWNYSRRFEGDTAHTRYQAKPDAPSGDCMVGTTGLLWPVEHIKRMVLGLTSEKWTMTFDMCRGIAMRGAAKEKMHMEIPTLEPILPHLEGNIAVLYGTTDLHDASDYHSFTKELNQVVTSENCSISFASIARKVNQSWGERNIKQKCKEDIVHIGDNWADLYWPSPCVLRNRTESNLNKEDIPLHQSMDCLKFLFPTAINMEKMSETNQVKIIKQMIEDSKKTFSSDKGLSPQDSLNSLYDLLEELEHGMYPTASSLDILLAQLKNDFSKSTSVISKYVIQSKIFLFCKMMKICLVESKEVKDVSKLPPNLKMLVGKTIKTTLKDLEYFSLIRNIGRPENQDIVDQIDWIKRVSHTFLTKAEYQVADFAFQHEDHVYKIWRLMKEIVPEGRSDKLEASTFSYKDNKGKTVSVQQSIYADHAGSWYFSVTEKRGKVKSTTEYNQILENPPKLILIYKPKGCCLKTNTSIFLPYSDFIKNNFGSHQWKFLSSKCRDDQEMIFCTIFKGSIETENKSISSPGIPNNCPIVPTFSSAGSSLLSQTCLLSYKEPRRNLSGISLAMVILNFTDNEILISFPYQTSGTSGCDGNKVLDPFQAEVFFSRKVDYSFKGNVGVTVLSIENEEGRRNLALYWDVPYDRNLYVNRFAMIPLETTKEITSEEAYNDKAVQAAIYDARKAEDGPKSSQLGDYLVTVALGTGYRTRMQVVFMDLNSIKETSMYGI